MSAFFAVLALGALVGALFVGVLVGHGYRSGRAPAVLVEIGRIAPWGAAAVAVVSMVGSLYYSESAGFRPCELCWYQRIAMYPLALLLVIAAVRRESIARYAVPVAAIGLAVAVYHYQLEWFPDQGSACELDNPCSARLVEQFGFVSIPFMAGSGFAAVIALTLAGAAVPRLDEVEDLP